MPFISSQSKDGRARLGDGRDVDSAEKSVLLAAGSGSLEIDLATERPLTQPIFPERFASGVPGNAMSSVATELRQANEPMTEESR
jgi:hypothetical protein